MPFTLESLNVFLAGVAIFSLISIPFLFILKHALQGLLELVRAIGFVFRLTGAFLCLLWRIVRALVRPFAGALRRRAKTTEQEAPAVSSAPASPDTDSEASLHETAPACPPPAAARPRVLITGSVAGDLFGGLCALVFFGSVPAMFICMFTGFPQGTTAAAVLLMLSSIILSLMALRRRRQAAAKAVASQDMPAPDLRDSTKL